MPQPTPLSSPPSPPKSFWSASSPSKLGPSTLSLPLDCGTGPQGTAMPARVLHSGMLKLGAGGLARSASAGTGRTVMVGAGDKLSTSYDK